MINITAMKNLCCIMIVCIFLATSCTSSTSVKPSSTYRLVYVNRLDPEDGYQIYDAIIESSYADKPTLIILNQTYHYKLDDGQLNYLQEAYPVLTEFLGSYQKGAPQSHQLESLFTPNGTEVMLVDADYVNWIFEAEDFDRAWQIFHETHSDSYGYLRFSNVISNSEQNKALAFVDRHCGPICGRGELYLLSKRDEEWQVVETITIYLA